MRFFKDSADWYKFETMFAGAVIHKAVSRSLKYACNELKFSVINWFDDECIDGYHRHDFKDKF